MTKQEHSLLNRGPAKPWPKARDTPHGDVKISVEKRFTDPDTLPEPVSQSVSQSVSQPVSTPSLPVILPPVPTPSNLAHLITAVIVNFNTKNLLRQAYRTFHSFYSDIRIIMVDNASSDQSQSWIKDMDTRPHVTTVLMDRNVGHGPAMHRAIHMVDTPYVLTLDTDTETIKGGWLEQMIAKMKADDNLYAIGWKRWVDRLSGVPLEWHVETQPPEKFIPYIHPSCGLYRVSMYHTLSPFFHHGAPCLDNMREAHRRDLRVESFPISEYVLHLTAGTRRMYNGKWDPSTKEKRVAWKKSGNWPI